MTDEVSQEDQLDHVFCVACGGEGGIIEPCRECEGRGYRLENARLYITALETRPTYEQGVKDGLERAAKVARDYASKARSRGWTTVPDSAAKAADHIAAAIRAHTKEPI
jgi:hypothetical protein